MHEPPSKHDCGLPALQTFAQRETLLLAPYAMHSCDSLGRKHLEPEHPYRGPFQRDRDRVLHSAAYRRLSGKTQVFAGGMGDYHRTRLTHTQEVASIARTMSRALRLNEDLTEALALLHDIGHPPYGHAGEDVLNQCLVDDGGFCHNRHALTIAEELEIRYHRFPGLNLSHEVLQGQTTRTERSIEAHRPLLEVQVVDAADSVTYDAHDADDAVALGIVTLDELSEVRLIRELFDRVRHGLHGSDDEILRKALVHELIDWQVGDILKHASRLLAQAVPANAAEARTADLVIGPGAELAEQKEELEQFLYERVYRHDRVLAIREEAQQRLATMFYGYVKTPALLPEKFRRRLSDVGVNRAVGEYLAGMTDRFCNQEYERCFGGSAFGGVGD